MSKPKHTPGPWLIGAYEDDQPAIVTDEQTVAILDQAYFDNPIDGGELEANIHLIAAAPEMFEALNKAAIFIREEAKERFPNSPAHALLNDLMKVIARAEGRDE